MTVATRSQVSAEYLDAFGGSDHFPPLTFEHGDGAAIGYSVTLADGTAQYPLEFGGLTTLNAFWITADADIDVTIGSTLSNQSRVLHRGGVLGFAGGEHLVSAGVALTYAPGDGSDVHVRIFAAGD